MTSFNTVTHPSRETNVTNIGGDQVITSHMHNIIIHHHVHYNVVGVSAFPADHTGATGGDARDAFPEAAEHPGIVPIGAPGSVWARFLSMFGLR
ncbi:hypothetical protein FIBSPDRAFT_946333 [Athelia psychrophila]|uniref:Uncharacterized protein n=1 Tax=Athelia psychrophila TaxID=1759441 RepID=A0A166STR5_9AGAM|nr:hypothetical protein FIBSPDRAFT_946333 [Fibularhizoctonia sp. CBS 109695]